jgi:hypothetical protein
LSSVLFSFLYLFPPLLLPQPISWCSI